MAEKPNKKSPYIIIAFLVLALAGTSGWIVYDWMQDQAAGGSEQEVDDETEKVAYNFKAVDEKEVAYYSALSDQKTYYDPTTDKTSIPLEVFQSSREDTRSFNISMDYAAGWYAPAKEGKLTGAVTLPDDVRMVMIGGFGQAVGHETFLFLLADGSIYYIPAAQSIWNDSIQAPKKIEGISDVVVLKSANVGTDDAGGYHTTIAERLDGSFYDLDNYLPR